VKNPFLKNPRLIVAETFRYLGEMERHHSEDDKRSRDYERPSDRQVYSDEFYAELERFDEEVAPEPEHRLENELLNTFYRRKEQRAREQAREDRQQSQLASDSVMNFKRKKIQETSLKLHLGSKWRIKDYDYGCITTTSSLKMTALQSVRGYNQ
jgi:hypothetical protein